MGLVSVKEPILTGMDNFIRSRLRLTVSDGPTIADH